MSYDDLKEFIDELERRNLLEHIKEEVNCELEISEITARVCKKYGENSKALFFENVKNNGKISEIPVVTNLFGSTERMKMALGMENFELFGNKFLKFLKFKPEGFFEKLQVLKELNDFSSYFPETVKSGKCKEVIINEHNVDLLKFPVLKLWPNDGGKFITLPMVFTKDPETGMRNVGMYRMQVFDKNTTGMHWHIHKDGAEHYNKAEKFNKKLEVAVVIGCDPAGMYAATAPLPQNFDEVFFAGLLREKAIKLVKCETIDMEVPANAEIVLEGYVNPQERKLEGPFGDHTGYYSAVDYYPIFHITCITHREKPIYAATVTGIPPMEDAYIGKATERLFLPFIKVIIPEINDINLPVEGVFHNLCIVSINKKYPGHAKKVMFALWGLGQMMFTKILIVVDADVNIRNIENVLWVVGSRVEPKRDTVIIENAPADVLENASEFKFLSSKLGIDATRKWKEEVNKDLNSEVAEMSEEVRKKVDEKWDKFGL
ncbi:MAG: menaquinone biosynthesis decarboxylase [Candidatus Altarchaeum sp.]|nr:menaquinone biosynthesis decarboxylase [Candidatus Altarchaeum sp.]